MTPYYDSDGIKLYHADCREVLPHVTASGVVTDPPYGTEDLAGGYGRRQNWENDGKDHQIAGDKDLTVLREACKAMMLGHVWLLVFFAPRRIPEFCRTVDMFDWRGELIWNKRQPGLGGAVRYSHESIALLAKGEPEAYDALLSVLECTGEKEQHPHEKPVKLMKQLVGFCVKRGKTVLDPFCGTGSVLLAAKQLGRKAIGIEINEKYCELAAKRLEACTMLDFEPVKAATQDKLW